MNDESEDEWENVSCRTFQKEKAIHIEMACNSSEAWGYVLKWEIDARDEFIDAEKPLVFVEKYADNGALELLRGKTVIFRLRNDNSAEQEIKVVDKYDDLPEDTDTYSYFHAVYDYLACNC